MRFTPVYEQLQRQLHEGGSYGISGVKHAARIIDLAKRMGTRSVLDYGCGRRTLSQAMPFHITDYDPFIVECSSEPEVHDLVVCSDVLEHIEPDCLPDVLHHLSSKVGKLIFLDIACRPAKKVLSDGRNAHLIQEQPSWWLQRLMTFFEPTYFQTYEGGFVAVCTPKGALTT